MTCNAARCNATAQGGRNSTVQPKGNETVQFSQHGGGHAIDKFLMGGCPELGCRARADVGLRCPGADHGRGPTRHDHHSATTYLDCPGALTAWGGILSLCTGQVVHLRSERETAESKEHLEKMVEREVMLNQIISLEVML